ncbi:hypothetical protein CEY12_06000 [Chryseobacterium sp. T16E-39]|uniref:hypothetical protein n=1 Tax=Chryseobacterium sp. T16E-39 TaxID=2015076 RepID=UPI000B5B176E|nr:hypothetical protein [Chryseobacterium sp. T16E-39]ASK29683.1 hypothetical protein CEY12_06000 [Chryseobacterium sp. T16E-39]
MQTLTSISQLESIAFQRLANENFITGEVDFNASLGAYTGYLQITSTICIDFTDSRFCLTDEGDEISKISPNLEKAIENYLDVNYRSSNNDDEYDFADNQRKMNRENQIQ